MQPNSQIFKTAKIFTEFSLISSHCSYLEMILIALDLRFISRFEIRSFYDFPTFSTSRKGIWLYRLSNDILGAKGRWARQVRRWPNARRLGSVYSRATRWCRIKGWVIDYIVLLPNKFTIPFLDVFMQNLTKQVIGSSRYTILEHFLTKWRSTPSNS